MAGFVSFAIIIILVGVVQILTGLFLRPFGSIIRVGVLLCPGIDLLLWSIERGG